MRKRFLFPVLLLLALAACRGNTPVEGETPTPTIEPTDLPTSQPQAAAPTALTETTAPGCTAISPRPTPGPEEESLFASVNDADWVLGPDTAKVTLIEYSDFQ